MAKSYLEEKEKAEERELWAICARANYDRRIRQENERIEQERENKAYHDARVLTDLLLHGLAREMMRELQRQSHIATI